MSGFELRNGKWWCDQAAIDALSNEYGTPLYVYSRARLEENYRLVQYAFKALNAHIHFSVKSSSSGAILRVLRELGSGFDVVSAGEAYRALRAGADPASIVFAGGGASPGLANGGFHFHINPAEDHYAFESLERHSYQYEALRGYDQIKSERLQQFDRFKDIQYPKDLPDTRPRSDSFFGVESYHPLKR